ERCPQLLANLCQALSRKTSPTSANPRYRRRTQKPLSLLSARHNKPEVAFLG
ncbi:hypothetical protein BaRGS_00040489, partial [Batillaria attramentaria]